jgi:hypothetical protein
VKLGARSAPCVLALLLGAGATACADTTQNVRALRAYAQEDASLVVALDRLEDAARATELVDRILIGTTYTPGDRWVRRLPLDTVEARVIRAEWADRSPYASGQFQVPVLKLYRTHVERVFERDAPPAEAPAYPSLLAAIEGLGGRGARLAASFDAYQQALAGIEETAKREAMLSDEIQRASDAERKRREQELREARTILDRATAAERSARDALEMELALLHVDLEVASADRQTVLREGVTAVSVALRIELEALAMLPVIAMHAVRAMAAGQGMGPVPPTLRTGEQLIHLPGYVVGLRERMTRQAEMLQKLGVALATAAKTSFADAGGFELRESAVDQIVGLTLDSIRVDVFAGGEGFFFSSLKSDVRSSSSDGKTTYDYTGRAYRLDYKVRPILLASARLEAAFDYIRLPGAVSAGIGYQTDRVWSSGGSIESTSLSRTLGVKGTASDVIDGALGFLGVRAGAKIARFDAGTVELVSAPDGRPVSNAPLQLTYVQADLGYDVLFALGAGAERAFVEELVVGARYVDYRLPRILYDLKDVSTTSGRQDFRFVRESPAQVVESKFYMLGGTLRLGQGESPRWSPFVDVGLYGGAGPTSFYFLKDANGGDVAQNHDDRREVAGIVDGSLAAGLRWRLLPRGARIRADLRADYRAEILYWFLPGSGHRIDFGGTDVFHGPRLSIHGAL